MDIREILTGIQDDPEGQRRQEADCQRLIGKLISTVGRLREGPDAPTDRELLNLVDGLFHACEDFTVTPFRKEFDPLIERLSFTNERLDEADDAMLKTAWTEFIERENGDFTWPLNEGMADWYTDRGMVSHAIAVYEHLYSCVRRGELHQECSDNFEPWLVNLLNLCRQRNLPQRARHLCEVIEDFYNDGYVSLVSYAEALSLLPELTHAGIRQTIESDRTSTKRRLLSEHGALLDQLHHLTKKLVVEAELWSDAHWREVEPPAAPLRWALALESEFHHKVFIPYRRELGTVLGDRAPRPQQTCGLSQMIELVEKAGSNVGVKIVLETLHGGERLASGGTLNRLKTIRDHRNAIAHVRTGKAYTAGQCSEFLRTIGEYGWVFEFLTAIQPK